MKKLIAVLCACLCLFASGCSNNEFAKEQYNSTDLIVQSGDRYAKYKSVFNTYNEEYSLTAKRFDGRQTLWSDDIGSDKDCQLTVSLTMKHGNAKLVYIDDSDNLTTLVEGETDGDAVLYLTLKSGRNRIKLVGYDCRDIKLVMKFDE